MSQWSAMEELDWRESERELSGTTYLLRLTASCANSHTETEFTYHVYWPQQSF